MDYVGAFGFGFCGVTSACVFFGFGGRLCFGLWAWFRLPHMGLLWGWCDTGFLCFREPWVGFGFCSLCLHVDLQFGWDFRFGWMVIIYVVVCSFDLS